VSSSFKQQPEFERALCFQSVRASTFLSRSNQEASPSLSHSHQVKSSHQAEACLRQVDRVGSRFLSLPWLACSRWAASLRARARARGPKRRASSSSSRRSRCNRNSPPSAQQLRSQMGPSYSSRRPPLQRLRLRRRPLPPPLAPSPCPVWRCSRAASCSAPSSSSSSSRQTRWPQT